MIAILDFGSQYTHLIARRVRELGVLSHIYPADARVETLGRVDAVILSGGPQDVTQQKIHYDPSVFTLGVPILGLCYGHQLLAYHFGGDVRPGTTKEYGKALIHIHAKGALVKGLARREQVWMSHGDSVHKVPSGFKVLATTNTCPVAAMGDDARKMYGLQFHPEVFHTTHGKTLLKNFLFTIAHAKKDWNIRTFYKQIEDGIRTSVGDRKVFLLVSGGVDSSVAFALLEKVLGKEQVYGLHIDTGFMRLNESAKITQTMTKAGFTNLHVLDARQTFFRALRGVTDPERKRKIIGRLYLEVKEDAMRKLKMNPAHWMLAQGTIYPDTIESGGTKHADTIKTHHNRVPEVLELIKRGLIIEPLKELYKDEVRALGRKLGLPSAMIERHPFPGSGLAIRILASAKEEKVNTKSVHARKAQKTLEDLNEEHHATLTGFLLPLRSVGVQGDNRTYAHPFALEGKASWHVYEEVAVRMANAHKAINRVVRVTYAKQSLEKGRVHRATLTPKRVQLLQQIDDIVMNFIERNKLDTKIWQFPVVLAPFGVTKTGESVILRPVVSEEAMTVNFYRMNEKLLAELVRKTQQFNSVDYIFYDVTNKPPGTIEWE